MSQHVCTPDYILAHEDAARRLRNGEHQLYCETCKLWRWPEECDHEDRIVEWLWNIQNKEATQ